MTCARCCINRITSTYVEKIRQIANFYHTFRDHLHIRGENRQFLKQTTMYIGSPPHTWRKSAIFETNNYVYRITSTYVEKINKEDIATLGTQDHLHIRGENTLKRTISFNVLGSPPHTWRKSCLKLLSGFRLRITSTYVEKIFAASNSDLFTRDHLHIRGENFS